jgi:hypothetical protein
LSWLTTFILQFDLTRDRLGSKRGRPLWTEVMELMGAHDPQYKEIRDEFYANEEK